MNHHCWHKPPLTFPGEIGSGNHKEIAAAEAAELCCWCGIPRRQWRPNRVLMVGHGNYLPAAWVPVVELDNSETDCTSKQAGP